MNSRVQTHISSPALTYAGNDLAARVVSEMQRSQEAGFAPWAVEHFVAQAREIVAMQIMHNAVYRAYIEKTRGQPWNVTDIHSIADIPALPINAYKCLRVAITGDYVARWESSTTMGGTPSQHFLPSLDVYEASMMHSARRLLCPDGIDLLGIQLFPNSLQLPHSSLAHMLDAIRLQLCTDNSAVFADDNCVVDGERAWSTLQAAADSNQPVLLLATSFALIDLLEQTEGFEALRLPPGSRVMDTGGYKGRTRERTREEIEKLVATRLGVNPQMFENEFGMSELSSQAYLGNIARSVGHPVGSAPRWQPPWMRTRVVNPTTLADVADGETGLLVHYDLANIYSCCAVRTEDVGIRRGDSWELVGRSPGARLRGCSLRSEQFVQPTKAPSSEAAHSASFAGRQVAGDFEKRIGLMELVRETWRDDSPEFEEAVAATVVQHDLPEAEVRRQLRRVCEDWNAENIQAVLDRDLDDVAQLALAPRRIAHIAAATIPGLSIESTAWGLVAGSSNVVRMAATDTWTRQWAAAVQRVAPALATLVECVSDDTWAEVDWTEIDAAVVYGSDDTLKVIRAQMRPDATLVAHGSKRGIAVLAADALEDASHLDRVLQQLADDICAFNQRGCMNPIEIFVEGDHSAVEPVDIALADAVERTLADRAPTSPTTAFEARHRADALMLDSLDNTPGTPPPPALIRVTARASYSLVPFANFESLADHLIPRRGILQTAVVAATGDSFESCATILTAAGCSRVCQPGEAHSPPFGWKHDGISPIASLLGIDTN